MVALGVYQAAFELGLKIPNDISVIGFDGLDLMERLGPPLTTVDIHPRQLGARAAEALLKAIRNELPAARSQTTSSRPFAAGVRYQRLSRNLAILP